MPKKFGLWVYSGDENGDGVSDNYDCMSTFTFKVGPSHTNARIKITPTEQMDWIGWKWLEFDISKTWSMPITFNYFMVSNINKALKASKNYRTTLMFDDLKYIYTDTAQDNDGPVFSNTAPQTGGIYQNHFTFSTVITDAANTVDASSIAVAVNGTPVSDYVFDAAKGRLTLEETGLTNGQSLRITVKAKDSKGNEYVPYIDNTYTVDLAADKDAPVLSNVAPTDAAVVRIPSPRIGFRLSDAKSGVNPDSIMVKLDGKTVSAYFDASTGWGYVQPDFTLADGDYALTINASDKQGNAMATYSDTLTLQPIAQPSDPENFAVSIVPDTQGNDYTEKIYQRAKAQNTDFVIHLGDIVDGAGEQEYIDGKAYLDSIGKPYLTIPRNHEGGAMNLNYYTKYFGSLTYTFDYSCTRFIALNSAYNQGISATDSTLYHTYLKEMLATSTTKNIVIYNHVITRDHYSTEHNMTAEEAEHFEGILTAYKAAKTGAWLAALINFIYAFIPTVLGIITLALINMGRFDAAQFESVGARYALPVLAMRTMPALICGLLFSGIISATMSSSDSDLLGAGSIFANDIYKAVLKPDATSKQVMRVTKIVMCIVGVAPMFIALFNTSSIVSILMFCFTLRAAGSFFPYVMGHYWKKASTGGTIASLLAGTLVVVYLEHISKGVLFGIKFSQPVIPGLVAAFICFIVFSLLMPPKVESTELAPEETN